MEANIYIFVLISILYLVYRCTVTRTRTTVSTFDNREYTVLDSNTDAQALQVANALAHLNARAQTLISRLERVFPDSDITKTLIIRYSPDILSEAPIQKGMTTYTVNKTSILMCIKSRIDDTMIYDINLLMYILIHELAHMANKKHGHGKEFINIFKFLLEQAIIAGAYTPENYRLEPKEYCDIELNSYILK